MIGLFYFMIQSELFAILGVPRPYFFLDTYILDYKFKFKLLVPQLSQILPTLTVSIASRTSNGSCRDTMTLPISNWLFYSEGRVFFNKAAILSDAFSPIQNYKSDTSWAFYRLYLSTKKDCTEAIEAPILFWCHIHKLLN